MKTTLGFDPPSVSTGFQFTNQWLYLKKINLDMDYSSNMSFGLCSDGYTLWAAIAPKLSTTGNILLGNLNQQTSQQISNMLATAIAAVSPHLAYLLPGDQQNQLFSIDDKGNTSALPVLPGGANASQITASADTGLWVLTTNGGIYSLANPTASWVAVDNASGSISYISTGNNANIYGVSNNKLVQYQPGSGWSSTVAQPFASGPISWISACADGSIWAQNGGISSNLAMYPAGGPSWMSIAPPDSNAMVFGPTAGSGSTLFAVVSTEGSDPYLGPSAFKVGLTNLPASNWPPMNTEETDAYNYISQQLGTPDVRKQYTDSTEPFEDWFTQVYGMSAPTSINADDFNSMKSQLLLELKCVSSINKLFVNLNDLNTDLGVVNSDQLQSVSSMVGLANNPQDNDSPIGAIFKALFENIAMILANEFSTYAYYGVSLVISLLEAGLSKTSGQNNTSPNYNFQLKYGQLAQFMANTFLNAGDALGNYQTSILSDWRRMNFLGSALISGTMAWPDGKTMDTAKVAAPAYVIFFYKVLMPTKWKLVKVLDWMVGISPNFPGTKSLSIIPDYDRVQACQTDSSNEYMVCTVDFCQAIDACDNPFTCSSGDFSHFPSEDLLNAIIALGISQSDFLTNQSEIVLNQVEIEP